MNGLDSIATLPGPRRHVLRLAAALDAGRSCVWFVPDTMVDDGSVNDLLYEVESRCEGHRIPGPVVGEVRRGSVPTMTTGASSHPAPPWARDRFNLLDTADLPVHHDERLLPQATTSIAERALSLLDPAADAVDDPLPDLVSAEYLYGTVLTLRAWHEPEPQEVGAFLVRFAAMSKESALTPSRRVRLLVVARERDLPAAVVERLDAVTTTVVWWWGAVGRLDTAVVIADARPLRPFGEQADLYMSAHDLVIDEVISEVAGPDLGLAAHLSASWDGYRASLPDLVTAYASQKNWTCEAGPGRRGGERPPKSLLPAWSRGVADRWDGEVRISPAAMSTDRFARKLDRLIWRGQARALNPVVDRLRVGLEEKIRPQISSGDWAVLMSDEEGQAGTRDRPRTYTVLELNKMVSAVRSRYARLSRHDEDLLYCLRDVRNALAHLVALSDDELREMTRIVHRATASW